MRVGQSKNQLKVKKLARVFGTLLIASFVLVSCGNSMDSDAKKLAKLYCENQEILERVMAGDESAMEDAAKFAEEAEALSEEMMNKYTTEKENIEFTKAVMKETENCK